MAADTLSSPRTDSKQQTPKQAARSEAKSLGLRWRDVVDCFRMLREVERERRELPNAIRAAAWQMATASSPKCWPFWRHGFRSRYGKRVDDHDYTAIPGYDEIHQQIQSWFHQHTGPDGEQKLFEFLLSPYERFATSAELWDEALAMVEEGTRGEEATERRSDRETEAEFV